MDYKSKYLKYKNKYMMLKMQNGGNKGMPFYKLKEKFNEIIEYGKKTRSNKENGFDNWQKVKSSYSDEIKHKRSEIIEDLMIKANYKYKDNDQKYSEVTINGINIKNMVDDKLVEVNHFLVQLFRIPNLSGNEMSELKILQVAYNIGQYQAELYNNTYDEAITSFFVENGMSNIETYIDEY